MAAVGLIGGVGFQQQAFHRQRRRERPQPVRPVISHRAAQSNQKPQVVEPLGLIGAAGKTVDHAAQRPEATDRGDHCVHSAPRMHDHRQFEVAGETQLAVEIYRLLFGVEPFDEKIQTAFAYRHRPLALDPFAQ